MIESIKNSKGMTLIEVLVGIAILMVAVIPLLGFYTRISHSARVQNNRIAYALLRGETEIMYKKHQLPDHERSIMIDGMTYKISCDVAKTAGNLVEWSMKVGKGSKDIAAISGLLYSPQNNKK